MSKAAWVAGVAALMLLSLLSSHRSVRGDTFDVHWRQEDPKFAATSKYCLYTGNSMIQSAARKAFNAVDAHFGGILNPVQFQESCANFSWVYWVDENSGDCIPDPGERPAIACAMIWHFNCVPTDCLPGTSGCTPCHGTEGQDSLHTHGNGGHIGVDTSYWDWDNQGVMDAAAGQELGHLWGLDHVPEEGLNCSNPHSHPTAMGYAQTFGSLVKYTCSGATGLTSTDLAGLDPFYSTTNVPLFAHLEANGWNPHDGTFYWYPDLIHEEAWFSIERKAGTGSWANVTPWAAANSSSFANINTTLLPTRQTGTATGQDCWRMLAWSNLWASNYSSVSCASRPGTSFPVDGLLVQYVGYGTSEIVAQNLSAETVTVKLYDGLLGLGGSTTPLRTCYNRAQGTQCTYSYAGRGTGGWHSIEMIRPNGESWAWAVSVASDSQGQPPSLPTPDPTPTPIPKDPNGDTDGDTVPNSSDLDDDNDGCPDVKELQTASGSQGTGGLRDPHNPWDYFNPTHDHQNRVDDILLVVAQYHKDQYLPSPPNPPNTPNPDYTTNTDRTTIGPNPWNLGPPNGQQRVDDILESVRQYRHDCS